MRVALVHAGEAPGSIPERMWEAICHTWPTADRYSNQFLSASHLSTTEPASSTPPSEWGPGSAVGASWPTFRPLGGTGTLLTEYDVVISTSVAAAHAVVTPPETVHICCVAGNAGVRSARTDFNSPPSVTHVLAVSQSAWSRESAWLRPCPGRVLPPPVDTTFFRPGLGEQRDPYYLTVALPGQTLQTELLLKACRQLHRQLVVVSPVPVIVPPDLADEPVTYVIRPTSSELRQYYRHSRGVVVAEPVDFHPALLEAQACGTPVVVYGQSGAADFVWDAEGTDTGTGLLFQEQTVASLVSAMEELERRPQRFSPALGLAHVSPYSQGHFETALRNQVDAWAREQMERCLTENLRIARFPGKRAAA